MPNLETLQRPTTLNLKKYDIVITPGVGGSHQPNLSFADAEVVVRPDERISPPTTLQKTIDSPFIDHEKYMQTVAWRRVEFYAALGKLHELNVVRNYDIPLVRAMWEQMQTEEQKRAFIDYEVDEGLAALGERHNMVEMTPRYIIDKDGKFRYSKLDLEPFEEMDKRAIIHYRSINSPDVVREEAGYRGRLKIQEKMADPNTPFGFTMAVVSGPGLAEGSLQQQNYVWFFVKKQQPVVGEVYVEMVPLDSNASYDQYMENISKIAPGYFENRNNVMDLHLLENPLEFEGKSVPEIFKMLTGEFREYKQSEKFAKFKEENTPRLRYFLEAVCAAIFDPKEVARRWNAVVAGGEMVWGGMQMLGEKVVDWVSQKINLLPKFKDIVEEMAYFAKQKIENILALCGLSGGIALGGGLTALRRFSIRALTRVATSVSSLLDKDGKGGLYYLCECGAINSRIEGKTDPACGSCGSDVVGCAPEEHKKSSSYELPKAA